MSDVLIREVDERVVDLLKAQAQARGRSLQAELRHILEQAAQAADVGAARRMADRIRDELGGRQVGDSAVLVAEDRVR